MGRLKRILALPYFFVLILLRFAKLLLWIKSSKQPIYIKHWFCDLGNNMIQIAHAEFLAKKSGSTLHLPSHPFLNIPSQYPVHSIVSDRMFDGGSSASTLLLADLRSGSSVMSQWKPLLYRTFFYQYDLSPFKPDLNHYRQILRDRVLPLIPYERDESIGDETLVIHLRSGDVFNDQDVHGGYIQPPLSFYLEVIDRFNFKKIVIVTQSDFQNPCIHQLKQKVSGVKVQALSLSEDVNTILSARNLIVGMSTFSLALAFTSKNIQKLFIPQFNRQPGYWRTRFWSPIMQLFLRDDGLPAMDSLDFEVYPTKIENYIPVGGWKNTLKQRDLMVNHNRDNISWFS